MTQKPLLIAIEGCDGTGKTTLVAALVQAFLGLGILAASIKRPAPMGSTLAARIAVDVY